MIVIASFFSFNSFAQRNARKALENAQDMMSANQEMLSSSDLAIVSYRVEERINMTFGSSVTTYEVSSLSLINNTDLGQNNTRIITPKYAKVKSRAVLPMVLEFPAVSAGFAITHLKPIGVGLIVPKEVKKSVGIDLIATYERVLERGYKSADMFKRVANSRFFDGDLVVAAKWYAQLFGMTTDIEPIYYYRYAQSLKAIHEEEKAIEMMKIFESKNL